MNSLKIFAAIITSAVLYFYSPQILAQIYPRTNRITPKPPLELPQPDRKEPKLQIPPLQKSPSLLKRLLERLKLMDLNFWVIRLLVTKN